MVTSPRSLVAKDSQKHKKKTNNRLNLRLKTNKKSLIEFNLTSCSMGYSLLCINIT
jgi:hypothetical protein